MDYLTYISGKNKDNKVRKNKCNVNNMKEACLVILMEWIRTELQNKYMKESMGSEERKKL